MSSENQVALKDMVNLPDGGLNAGEWHAPFSIGFLGRGSFPFKEQIIVVRDEVQKGLFEFKQKHQNLPSLFIPKYDCSGRKK